MPRGPRPAADPGPTLPPRWKARTKRQKDPDALPPALRVERDTCPAGLEETIFQKSHCLLPWIESPILSF
ncbi:unnamed protein product [Caretta caretta]